MTAQREGDVQTRDTFHDNVPYYSDEENVEPLPEAQMEMERREEEARLRPALGRMTPEGRIEIAPEEEAQFEQWREHLETTNGMRQALEDHQEYAWALARSRWRRDEELDGLARKMATDQDYQARIAAERKEGMDERRRRLEEHEKSPRIQTDWLSNDPDVDAESEPSKDEKDATPEKPLKKRRPRKLRSPT